MTRSRIELSLSLSLIFNLNLNLNDPKEFDDLKEISIESTDFDNPKVYRDSSIFDGLVETFSSQFFDAKVWVLSIPLEPSTLFGL